MAYPDAHYRQRRANGEKIAGKNLHKEECDDNEATIARSHRIVYGIVAVMLWLVLSRIILRLAGMEDTAFGYIIHSLTDPYVWIFNSLFASSPSLLLARVEPGSLMSLVFFPLFGWAIQGLVTETHSNRNYRISRTKVRR